MWKRGNGLDEEKMPGAGGGNKGLRAGNPMGLELKREGAMSSRGELCH